MACRKTAPALCRCFADSTCTGELTILPQPIHERLPEFSVPFTSFRYFSSLRSGLLTPIVWSRHDPEMRSRTRFVNLPKLNNHAEELCIFSCTTVQEIQRCPMFVSELFGDPDDRACIVAGRVGEQLTEMGMVGWFQLVLDDYRTVVAYITRQQVERECSDGRFTLLKFKLYP